MIQTEKKDLIRTNDHRPKKVNFKRQNENLEKRDNIYIQNNHNESALISFYGNNKLEEKKITPIIKTKKLDNSTIDKKFYESDKLKNIHYENDEIQEAPLNKKINPIESSNTDEKNTISHQDRLLSNENFFKENYKGEFSPQKNRNFIQSIQTGGSLELSYSKQQSDTENIINTNHNNIKYSNDQKVNNTPSEQFNNQTQKLTFKNGNHDNIDDPDGINNNNSHESFPNHKSKINNNKNLNRNANITKNNYEVETNTNSHYNNTSNSRDIQGKEKSSFRTGLNYKKQGSSDIESSVNTIRQNKSKFMNSPTEENAGESNRNKNMEIDKITNSKAFSIKQNANCDQENNNKSSIRSIENSQIFQNRLDENISESQIELRKRRPESENQVNPNSTRKEDKTNSLMNSNMENTLVSNDINIMQELDSLRKQNKELHSQLNQAQINKHSLTNKLRKISSDVNLINSNKKQQQHDYTPQKVFLGEFIEKVLDKSLFLYKNNNCHTCSKLLTQGKSSRDCPKKH